jgi:TolA-binding protein
VLLEAGDEWVDEARPVAATASRAPAPAPPAQARLAEATGARGAVAPAGPARRPRADAGSKTVASATETRRPPAPPSFNDAWSLLRGGRAAEAAAAFAAVAEAGGDGDGGLVEDARYWQGVALARAGDARPAQEALAAFVARFPSSPRAGEASVILGWSLVRAGGPGAREQARAAFARAARDPADRVRASAQEGLRQLDGRAP